MFRKEETTGRIQTKGSHFEALNIKYGYRIHYFMSKDDIISVELHFDQ
jgi:hypothetical protein